jgi:hypothetical protein
MSVQDPLLCSSTVLGSTKFFYSSVDFKFVCAQKQCEFFSSLVAVLKKWKTNTVSSLCFPDSSSFCPSVQMKSTPKMLTPENY